MHPIVIPLLIESRALTLTDLVHLSRTCTYARDVCYERLHNWQTKFAPTYQPVLDAIFRRLPFLHRCTGSAWYNHESEQPQLYDTMFWTQDTPALQTLLPTQLALLYAIVMKRFATEGQRINKYESSWQCAADRITRLPARLPSTSGFIAVPNLPNLLSVTIVTNLLTGRVKQVTFSRQLFPIGETPTCIDIEMLQNLLLQSRRMITPTLNVHDWYNALFALLDK